MKAVTPSHNGPIAIPKSIHEIGSMEWMRRKHFIQVITPENTINFLAYSRFEDEQ